MGRGKGVIGMGGGRDRDGKGGVIVVRVREGKTSDGGRKGCEGDRDGKGREWSDGMGRRE